MRHRDAIKIIAELSHRTGEITTRTVAKYAVQCGLIQWLTPNKIREVSVCIEELIDACKVRVTNPPTQRGKTRKVELTKFGWEYYRWIKENEGAEITPQAE